MEITLKNVENNRIDKEFLVSYGLLNTETHEYVEGEQRINGDYYDQIYTSTYTSLAGFDQIVTAALRSSLSIK